MPTLKQIRCSIELSPSNTPLKEHNIRYRDGAVECFVPVPDSTTPFSVHVQSDGYIASGLAVFVFMDGRYQCNRNRAHLFHPVDGMDPRLYQVDFRLRQKEEKTAKGTFVGREWTFSHLDISKADNSKDLNPDYLHNVGTIEVLVLRCESEEASESTSAEVPAVPTRHKGGLQISSAKPAVPRSSGLGIRNTNATSAIAPVGEEATIKAAGIQAAKEKSASAKSPCGLTDIGTLGGLFGMDGTDDDGHPHYVPLDFRSHMAPEALPAQQWDGTIGGAMPVSVQNFLAGASHEQHTGRGADSYIFRVKANGVHAANKPNHGFMGTSMQYWPPADINARPYSHPLRPNVISRNLGHGNAGDTAGGIPGNLNYGMSQDAGMQGALDYGQAARFDNMRASRLQPHGAAQQVPQSHVPVNEQHNHMAPRFNRNAISEVQEGIRAAGATTEIMIAQFLEDEADLFRRIQDVESRARLLPAASRDRPGLLLEMHKLFEEQSELERRRTRLQLELDKLMALGYQPRNAYALIKDQPQVATPIHLGNPPQDSRGLAPQARTRADPHKYSYRSALTRNTSAHGESGFKHIGEGVTGGDDEAPKQDWTAQGHQDQPREKWSEHHHQNNLSDPPGCGNNAASGWPADTDAKPASRHGERDTGWADQSLKSADNGCTWDRSSREAPQNNGQDGWANSSKLPSGNAGNGNRTSQSYHSAPKSGSHVWKNEHTQITQAEQKGDKGSHDWHGNVHEPPNVNAWDKTSSARDNAKTRTSSLTDGADSNDLENKPYWDGWRKPKYPHPDANQINEKPRRVPRSVCLYPKPALPAVSQDQIGNAVSHGIQPGKGALYAHRCHRPVYLDTMQKPYAVFSFKYRSVAALEKILGHKLRDEMSQMVHAAERQKLEGLPRTKLVEELMRRRFPHRNLGTKCEPKADGDWSTPTDLGQAKNDWSACGAQNNNGSEWARRNGDHQSAEGHYDQHCGRSQSASTINQHSSKRSRRNQSGNGYGGNTNAAGWTNAHDKQPNATAWGNASVSRSRSGQENTPHRGWQDTPVQNRNNEAEGRWDDTPQIAGGWDGGCDGQAMCMPSDSKFQNTSIMPGSATAGLPYMQPTHMRTEPVTSAFVPNVNPQDFETESERRFKTGEWCAREEQPYTITPHLPTTHNVPHTTPKPPHLFTPLHGHSTPPYISPMPIQANEQLKRTPTGEMIQLPQLANSVNLQGDQPYAATMQAPTGQQLPQAAPTKAVSVCNGPGDMNTATGFERESETSAAAHPFNGNREFLGSNGDAAREAVQW